MQLFYRAQPARPIRCDTATASDQRYFLALLVCLGALLALRLAGLHASALDLVMDEAQYWSWSRDLDFGYFSKPPLIAWLIRGAGELCGQSEACIRSAAPVLYTGAALMIFASGRALFDARIGFWSAIVFATLPGVSYSSHLMTTDVPLIFLWTVMLYFWVMLVKQKSMGFAILLGIAVGAGLEVSLHPSPATARICRRPVWRVRPHSAGRARARRLA